MDLLSELLEDVQDIRAVGDPYSKSWVEMRMHQFPSYMAFQLLHKCNIVC